MRKHGFPVVVWLAGCLAAGGGFANAARAASSASESMIQEPEPQEDPEQEEPEPVDDRYGQFPEDVRVAAGGAAREVHEHPEVEVLPLGERCRDGRR